VPPIIAAVICVAGIIFLFRFDRNEVKTSPALWIPLAWFLLACSRSLARWLNLSNSGSLTDQMLEGNPVDRAVFTALLVLGLIVLVNRRGKVGRSLGQSLPVLLFFAYCLLSLLWSDFPGVAFKRWNKAIGDWVMILIIWTDPHPIAAIKRLLAITTYTLIPLSVLFIKYYPDLGRGYGRWLGETHFVGVTTDKNTLGAICLLFGIASVWRILELYSDPLQKKQRTRPLIVQGVILAMIWWLFSIMDAMTALSCFLLATLVLFVIRLRMFAKNPFLIHGLLLVAVAVPVSVALLGVSPGALREMGRNATLTERTDIWAMVIKLVPNRWLGAGYESFWLGPRLDAMIENVTRWWVPNQSHNGYLEIYANLGWVGVAGLALVVFWGYLRVVRNWRRHLPASNLMLAYFLIGLIFNVTEAAFFRMMSPVWLFFLIALTAPQRLNRDSSQATTNSRASKPDPMPETVREDHVLEAI
jgi:exopolysaccharide production protein ExoQ